MYIQVVSSVGSPRSYNVCSAESLSFLSSSFPRVPSRSLTSSLTARAPPLLLLHRFGIELNVYSQVWRSQLDRDHPDTIKRRFVSAAFMTIVSPVILTSYWSRQITWPEYWLLIGSGVCLEIRCWTFVRKVHAHGSHRPQNSRYFTLTVIILILSQDNLNVLQVWFKPLFYLCC